MVLLPMRNGRFNRVLSSAIVEWRAVVMVAGELGV
jgi:hypothetical protein